MQESWVPSWEMRFCYLVGGMPWNQFLEKKPYTTMYEKVVTWDDLAGEEAFNNAKSRFWAKINHLPCDLLSPDPNANIDVIDWDSPEDLYREVELEWQCKFLVVEEPDPAADLEELKRCFLLTREELLLEMKVEPTGWDDEDDAKLPQSDDWENKAVRVDNQVNEWGPAYDNRGGQLEISFMVSRESEAPPARKECEWECERCSSEIPSEPMEKEASSSSLAEY